MKSLLLMMSFLSVMSFRACSKDYIPSYLENISIHVKEAEKVLDIYDRSVQEALDNNEMETIPQLSANATVAMTVKLERIQELPTNQEVGDLQKAAIEYIEAMFEMIKAQEAYSDYSQDMTLEQAREMDSFSIRAKKKMEEKKQTLLVEKEEVEATISE